MSIKNNKLEDLAEDIDISNTDELKTFEGDILSAILEAANFKNTKNEELTEKIVRNGVVLLQFNIRPLTEQEYNTCRTKNTRYKANKQLGIKVPEKTDNVRYRSQLIYTATVDSDRAKLWDNKTAWERLNVASGVDMVDMVLKAGEKDAICVDIDNISGYGDDLEEAVKN